MGNTTTTESPPTRPPPASPGLLLAFADGRACSVAMPLVGGELVLGRQSEHGRIHDPRASREHVRVRYDGRTWTFEDLDSRNGTLVDGARIGTLKSEVPQVLRIGETLLIPCTDVFAHDHERVRHADRPVVGAALCHALEAIAEHAKTSRTLHLAGEPGTGRENAARHFHASSPCANGPFVSVDCARLPAQRTAQTLFGADPSAPGAVLAAHGGTLMLDEISELEPAMQERLLRVLTTGELLAPGASEPIKVDVRLCWTTRVELDRAVGSGRFRADLLYRLASPSVAIPALADRMDEIAWHVQHEIARAAPQLTVHVSLVEACLTRVWNGNLRELLSELRLAAAQTTLRAGREVRAMDLEAARTERPTVRDVLHDAELVQNTLDAHAGDVGAAAHALGVHRDQLKRWMSRQPAGPYKSGVVLPRPDGPDATLPNSSDILSDGTGRR